MTKRFLKSVLAVSALGLGLVVAGCDGHITVNGDDGVALSDFDMSGEAPTGIALVTSDKVVVTEGEKLAIKVSGDPDAVAALRFNRDGGMLGIMREDGSKVKGTALIAITMPPVHEVFLGGSGVVEAPKMVDKAEVNIAGSGQVKIAQVSAQKMSVNLLGSGSLQAAGTAKTLNFNVAGSGGLMARGLKVDNAEVNIAGSGNGEFSSDGTVKANVAGSGEVTVYGRATCKISAMGAGKLTCKDGAWSASDAPVPPNPGATPSAPPPPPPPPAPE